MRAFLVLVLAGFLACRQGPSVVEATGTIEIVETDLAPLQTARVARFFADEGAAVRRGDTLVVLTLGTLDAELDARRARLAVAESQLRDLEAGARPAEIERAEADLRMAQAEAERAQHELDRLTTLFQRGDVSEQQLENVRTLARTTASRRDAAANVVRLIREGPRADRVRAARNEVIAARASVGGARSAVAELVLIAPVDGIVMVRHADPGEVLPAGAAALTLGEPNRPFVRVYVAPSAVPAIRVGDSVTVHLDGRDERIPGRVVAIDSRSQFTPRVALTEDERADLMFGVKVEISDTRGLVRAGLPATVRFVQSAAPASP